MSHTIGSHSDDRGGDSDMPCYCDTRGNGLGLDGPDADTTDTVTPPESPKVPAAEGIRDKLIGHIHRPIAWAKVGKQDDVYAMDVEKTDHLAEDMADYALQILASEKLALLDRVEKEVQKQIEDTYPGVNNGLNQEMTGHGALDFVRFAIVKLRKEMKP